MNKKILFTFLVIVITLIVGSCKSTLDSFRTIKPEVLKDKIAGGWAGKMIGVTYGAPTEFRAQSKIFEDSIKWKPSDIKGCLWQDDIYVQLTFLMSMDKYGIDAPAKKFQEMFAKAGYPLWHANMQARKNYYDSIFVPASGSPEYNLHADDIDFQIEADYIGFMCPGMPNTGSGIAQKIGHIMNYGDGVYGGIFVGALYSEAFFESDIPKIIENALRSIPEESDYYRIINDVIKLHKQYSNWQSAWKDLEAKWGDVDICGAGTTFNIDAKLNGAFIVMGLLYGEGDPLKTLEITTRCGQDSDCNPSNAMAVLGVIKGFSGLPHDMQEGVKIMSDSIFINTSYSFNSAVASTEKYAHALILKNGGKIDEKDIIIQTQLAVAPAQEISFPNVVFDKTVSVFDKNGWSFKGGWKPFEIISESDKKVTKQSMYSDKADDKLDIDFSGTGISVEGNWYKDGGKADIYVDGNLHRRIDTYYNFANQQHSVSIWHVLNLKPGDHKIRIIVKGEKRPESAGTRVYITSATIFKTAPKKNESWKFSFEK
jgi:hypothetical protein